MQKNVEYAQKVLNYLSQTIKQNLPNSPEEYKDDFSSPVVVTESNVYKQNPKSAAKCEDEMDVFSSPVERSRSN